MHTKGPWKVGEFCVWGGRFGDTYVAGTQTGVPESERQANARLIAVAPELLEALEKLVQVLGISEVLHEAAKYNNAGDCAVQFIREARAAIAKVNGE